MNSLRNIFKILYFIYVLILIFLYTKAPDGNWDSYKEISTNLFIRNLDHLILFYLLGALAMLINNNIVIFDRYIISAFLISILIEFIHLFLSYRGFQIIDLLYNIIGCLFGLISLYYGRKIYGKIINQKYLSAKK